MRNVVKLALVPVLALAFMVGAFSLETHEASAHPKRTQHAHTGVSYCGWQSYQYSQSNYCIWNGFNYCAWHSGYNAMLVGQQVHFYTQVISTGQIWYLGSHYVYYTMSYCPTA